MSINFQEAKDRLLPYKVIINSKETKMFSTLDKVRIFLKENDINVWTIFLHDDIIEVGEKKPKPVKNPNIFMRMVCNGKMTQFHMKRKIS